MGSPSLLLLEFFLQTGARGPDGRPGHPVRNMPITISQKIFKNIIRAPMVKMGVQEVPVSLAERLAINREKNSC